MTHDPKAIEAVARALATVEGMLLMDAATTLLDTIAPLLTAQATLKKKGFAADDPQTLVWCPDCNNHVYRCYHMGD